MTNPQPPNVQAIVGLRRDGDAIHVIDSTGTLYQADDPKRLWEVMVACCNGEEPPTVEATAAGEGPRGPVFGHAQGEAIKNIFVNKMREQYGDVATDAALRIGGEALEKLRKISRKGASPRWDDKKRRR